MGKRIQYIKALLEEANIDNGIIIDTADLFKNNEFGEFDVIKKSVLEAILYVTDETAVKAVIVNETAFFNNNKKDFIQLCDKAKTLNITMILCVKNISDKRTVYELLSGQRSEYLDIEGYTINGIQNFMQDNGFELSKEKNLEYSEEVVDDNVFLSKGSDVYQYLTWLDNYINAKLNIKYFIQLYKSSQCEIEHKDRNKEKSSVFLSIITRTQGNRIEALRETFLSLGGQSCLDFEVLVMGHNVNIEQERNIQQLILETPTYLREKIRFIKVEGGNRSTPINKGFENADGEYAVILDDDDLVFDHWVECFKEKAKEYPGKILHAYVIAQDWCTITTPEGEEALRACGSPQNQFCTEFHVIKELHGNFCPILGLAFPLNPYRKMGIKFDETLDTTEDWDYLMRVSNICGVVDIKEPTSMYRLWKNADTSHAIHSQNEWNQNRKKIRDRFREKPLLLSSKYVKEIMKLIDENPALFDQDTETQAQVTPLYYDNGNGFNERCVKRTGSRSVMPNVIYEFVDLQSVGEISVIRWDPYETGNIVLENPVVQIFTADGHEICKSCGQLNSNGFEAGNKIVFFHPDPQIVIPLRNKIRISKVIISGVITKKISQDMHDYLSIQYNANVVRRAKKVVKMVGKKVLHR